MKTGLQLISLAASLWSSLSWELICSDNEYVLPGVKCCKMCPAGEQLAKRCTSTFSTKCEPCDKNYYNDNYTYSWCKACAECKAEQGLREVRACQRTSNTVCACLPGHGPDETQTRDEKRCKPCPRGHFSLGGNEKCRPWTNCTASGKEILRSGKQDADTVCDQPLSQIPTWHPATHRSSFPKETGVFVTKLDSPPIVAATNRGFLWILTIVVLLLALAGVFLLFCRRQKKKLLEIACEEIYSVPCKDKETDYRMPIQEEDAGVKSKFVQG